MRRKWKINDAGDCVKDLIIITVMTIVFLRKIQYRTPLAVGIHLFGYISIDLFNVN